MSGLLSGLPFVVIPFVILFDEGNLASASRQMLGFVFKKIVLFTNFITYHLFVFFFAFCPVLLNMLNFSPICNFIPSFVSSVVSAISRSVKRPAGSSAGPPSKVARVLPALLPLASSSGSAGALKEASVPLVAR